MTLEAGRIRPDDLTTMQLVCEAVDMQPNRYSVIINKIEPEVYELLQNEEQRNEFFVLLNEGLPGTTYFFSNLHAFELQGKTDFVPILTEGFITFIENAPIIEIISNNVKDIRFNEFERIRQMLEEQIRGLRDDNRRLQQRIEEQDQRLTDSLRQQQQQQERFNQQFTEVNRNYQVQIREINEQNRIRMENMRAENENRMRDIEERNRKQNTVNQHRTRRSGGCVIQ